MKRLFTLAFALVLLGCDTDSIDENTIPGRWQIDWSTTYTYEHWTFFDTAVVHYSTQEFTETLFARLDVAEAAPGQYIATGTCDYKGMFAVKYAVPGGLDSENMVSSLHPCGFSASSLQGEVELANFNYPAEQAGYSLRGTFEDGRIELSVNSHLTANDFGGQASNRNMQWVSGSHPQVMVLRKIE